MNSLERVLAAVKFNDSDQVPVIAQVFGHAALIGGILLDEYIQDGDLLARCQLKALERYRYDAVFSVMDVNVETEALGSVLEYRKNQYAIIKKYALSKEGWQNDENNLVIPDPEQAGRMPEMLKAVEILKNNLKNEVLIVGCVLGPLTLATQLLGMETALFMAMDEPDRFARLLDFTTGVVTRFGVAQIKAGAHLPIVFDPSASPAVVPHQFFREFELPRLAKLFAAFKNAGSLANWLHIAGPVDSILPYYPGAGVNIANFDYCVTPETAMAKLSQLCLDGNIKPLSFVVSEPADIKAASAVLLKAFSGRGGFILSSGCEIPPESRPENVTAMVMAARNMSIME
ncbi:MAG: uroporphyrinogen decarboxylase family protein [Desulfamplus sp.]|nr:uroporphyrinogen decarboxylase family protein [Desulfamplus sp.]